MADLSPMPDQRSGDHDEHPRPGHGHRPAMPGRAVRLTLAALLPAAILTVVAMVWFWPRNAPTALAALAARPEPEHPGGRHRRGRPTDLDSAWSLDDRALPGPLARRGRALEPSLLTREPAGAAVSRRARLGLAAPVWVSPRPSGCGPTGLGAVTNGYPTSTVHLPEGGFVVGVGVAALVIVIGRILAFRTDLRAGWLDLDVVGWIPPAVRRREAGRLQRDPGRRPGEVRGGAAPTAPSSSAGTGPSGPVRDRRLGRGR